MVAIDSICKSFPPEVFEESELYVTCEPCIMCASAILHLSKKIIVSN